MIFNIGHANARDSVFIANDTTKFSEILYAYREGKILLYDDLGTLCQCTSAYIDDVQESDRYFLFSTFLGNDTEDYLELFTVKIYWDDNIEVFSQTFALTDSWGNLVVPRDNNTKNAKVRNSALYAKGTTPSSISSIVTNGGIVWEYE